MFEPVINFVKDVWANHKKGLAIFGGAVIVLAALSLIWGTPNAG